MSVAKGIVEVMTRNSVSRVYCVPGESYLALLDQFASPGSPDLISTRHEEGAGLMAEAHAKLTGEVGTVLVTRGPGLTHLAIAVHTAKQDSTPLVAIVGQVPTGHKHREAFQELDIEQFGASLAKWSVEIPSACRAVDIVAEAYRVARSGRPGPVIVSLPEDIDREVAAENDGWDASRICTAAAVGRPSDTVRSAIANAQRPAIFAGRPVVGRPDVRKAVERLASKLNAPVYNSWRRFDAFDNANEHFAGNLPILSSASTAHLKQADLIILVDDRLDEFTSLNYSIPGAQQTVVLVGGPDSALESSSDFVQYLESIIDTHEENGFSQKADVFRRKASELHCRFTRLGTSDEQAKFGLGHPAVLSQHFASSLPENAVVTSDAGTFASWIYRAFTFTAGMRFLGPTAGGMGYALPSALASKIANSAVPVYAIAGDGGFAMTMSELETGRRLGLGGIGMFVYDNEMYGTIAMHQDRHFPNRRVGIELGPIDYEAVANAFGWEFRSVKDAAQMAAVVREIAEQNLRALVHVPIPKDELSPLGFSWELEIDFADRASETAEVMA